MIYVITTKDQISYFNLYDSFIKFWIVFAYKVLLLLCCSKSNSSITQVFCGLGFTHASNLNCTEQTLEFIDRR